MLEINSKEKMKQIVKFYSLLNRDPEVPFSIKKKVIEGCVSSSILYASETWFTENYGKFEYMYMQIVKALLGVRISTCNDVILVEA